MSQHVTQSVCDIQGILSHLHSLTRNVRGEQNSQSLEEKVLPLADDTEVVHSVYT